MNSYRPNDYKIPRTMNEAFGPYEHQIYQTDNALKGGVVAVVVVAVIFLCAVAAFAAVQLAAL